MNAPHLDRVVQAHIPLRMEETIFILRRDVLPHIRDLQNQHQLRWFSFLLHSMADITGRADAPGLGIHLRLEPSEHLDPDRFLSDLPTVFQQPHRVAPLGQIAGVDLGQVKDADWAHAWRMVGEASEWVLGLLESHEDSLTLQQAVRFLHYITNPLTIGNRCVWIQSGQRF